MARLFDDPKRRIARAKEHIDDIETGITEFLKSQPYTRVIETDPQTRNKIHKIKLTENIPDVLLSQTEEVVEGLRSVLDKCGFAAAKASGNNRLKGTYFPIADTDQEITDSVIGRGRCKDVPDDILTLFRSFQPHKTGNPPIWALNKLAGGSKHRILVPVGMAVGNAFMESFRAPGRVVRMGFPPRWDWENDEMELCVVGPDPSDEPQYEMHLQMFVELSPIDDVRLGEAARALRAIAGEVERIALAAEAESVRLFG